MQLVDALDQLSNILTITLVIKEDENSNYSENKFAIDESIGFKYAEQLKNQRAEKDKIRQELIIATAERPTAKIKSCSDAGDVLITFSKPMNVREGFKNMSKGSSINLNDKLRKLKDKEKVPVSDIVEVEMVMGPDTVKENIGFTWKVDKFTT